MKKYLRVVYTAGDTPLGKLIRAVTGEPVSHVAIEAGHFIVHSSLLGVHVDLRQTFYEKQKLIYSIELPADRDVESIYNSAARSQHKVYDYPSLIWLGLRYLLHVKLRLPFPKANLWQITGMYTCTEFVSHLLSGKEDSLTTPYQHYLSLKASLENPNNV